MKKIDFLIRYEHKVRELESAILIKLELEKRGYSVALEGTYEYNNGNLYKPRVIVLPSVYCDGNLHRVILKYGCFKKAANMLYEQLIGIEDEESALCKHNLYGKAREILSFGWGKQTFDRLVKNGASREKVKIVGQINTDLLRYPFNRILKTKQDLAAKYALDVSKKWYLFISSFAYCELDELQKKLCMLDGGEENFNYMSDLSNNSRREILRWFEQVLQKYQNVVIIYRPHPDEARKSLILKQLEAKFPNFKVIGAEAIKHWINASDKIYNWYSTGLVDAIVLKKPYRLLRPVTIRRENDYRIYIDAANISQYESFEEDFLDLSYLSILNTNVFSYYYHFPDNNYVYHTICNNLEELINTNKYDIKYSLFEYVTFSIKRALHFLLDTKFSNILLRNVPPFKGYYRRCEEYKSVILSASNKEVASADEIMFIENNLKPYIYGEQI